MPSKVVPFITHKRLPARRGTNAVEPGTGLYAIRNRGLFFIWCYTDENYAKKVAARVEPGNATDIAANWRRNPEQLIHTDRSHD